LSLQSRQPGSGQISRRPRSKQTQHRASGEVRADPINFIHRAKPTSTMFWHHPLKVEAASARLRSAFHICERKFRNRGGKVTSAAQLNAGS